jgi:hypothetical protein
MNPPAALTELAKSTLITAAEFGLAGGSVSAKPPGDRVKA